MHVSGCETGQQCRAPATAMWVYLSGVRRGGALATISAWYRVVLGIAQVVLDCESASGLPRLSRTAPLVTSV